MSKAIRRQDRFDRKAAEEYSASLAQIGEGWWRQLAWAHQQGIPKVMGLSLIEWRDKYYGHLRLAVMERKKAVGELLAAGLSTRESAAIVGVDHSTVVRDSNGNGANAPPDTDTDQQNQQVADNAGANAPPRSVEIRRCDFRELLGSLTDVDAIITDPPYGKDAIPLYGELARLARSALKKSGVLAVMSGHCYLPEILPVWMDSGTVLVLPVAVYLAGLKLGKTLQRRETITRRVDNGKQTRQWRAGDAE